MIVAPRRSASMALVGGAFLLLTACSSGGKASTPSATPTSAVPFGAPAGTGTDLVTSSATSIASQTVGTASDYETAVASLLQACTATPQQLADEVATLWQVMKVHPPAPTPSKVISELQALAVKTPGDTCSDLGRIYLTPLLPSLLPSASAS